MKFKTNIPALLMAILVFVQQAMGYCIVGSIFAILQNQKIIAFLYEGYLRYGKTGGYPVVLRKSVKIKMIAANRSSSLKNCRLKVLQQTR
jgi:hypothetical protein